MPCIFKRVQGKFHFFFHFMQIHFILFKHKQNIKNVYVYREWLEQTLENATFGSLSDLGAICVHVNGYGWKTA